MIKNIRLLLSICFLLGIFSQAWAQNNILVTGKVTRKSTGEPLAGATVSVKGANVATTTNETGNFSINTTSGATLVVSYTGMTDMETTVRSAGEVNFTL